MAAVDVDDLNGGRWDRLCRLLDSGMFGLKRDKVVNYNVVRLGGASVKDVPTGQIVPHLL
jgi:hypothetical protein